MKLTMQYFTIFYFTINSTRILFAYGENVWNLMNLMIRAVKNVNAIHPKLKSYYNLSMF